MAGFGGLAGLASVGAGYDEGATSYWKRQNLETDAAGLAALGRAFMSPGQGTAQGPQLPPGSAALPPPQSPPQGWGAPPQAPPQMGGMVPPGPPPQPGASPA